MPDAVSVSPPLAIDYTRERTAPLSALHAPLYHPYNYQTRHRHIATPAGICSCAKVRETATTFCTPRGTMVIANKATFLHTKALSIH